MVFACGENHPFAKQRGTNAVSPHLQGPAPPPPPLRYIVTHHGTYNIKINKNRKLSSTNFRIKQKEPFSQLLCCYLLYLKYCKRLEFLPCLECALRKGRLIRCVGIILCFETEAEVLIKTDTVFAHFTVHKVTGIKLHTGKVT